jgi:FMN-dependent NADH-azoreductase
MSSKPKTLLVEFAPRGENSKTKKLREYFTDLIKDKTEITTLDLTKSVPDLLSTVSIKAYYKRNYEGKKLTDKELKSLQNMDSMRDQLLSSDYLILSSPMYNFGYPAVVKAWIDAVMQKGYVYDIDENGHVPKLQNLTVCIIYSAGITFDQINENESWNGLLAEGARLFEYMGAKVRVIHLEGVDMLAKKFVDFRTKNVAQKKLNGLARDWYGVKLSPDLEIY